MKNTFNRIRILVFGMMLGCATMGLSQADCMDFKIDEVIIQEGGVYEIQFTITNLSSQAAEWLALEYPPFTFFGPSLILEDIPAAGGSYSGSFELWDLHSEPLMPGDIIFFKAILENKTGWCCHLDGIPIKIPGEEPLCDCDNLEEAVAAGFSADFNCNLSSQILLSPRKAADCDSVIWRVYDYKNKEMLAADTSLGMDTADLILPSEIGFIVDMEIIRWDDLGNKCEENESITSEEVINCCVTSLSPIALILKRPPKTGNAVQVKWRVQRGTNFEFFTLIRYSDKDTLILDRVNAQLGKTNYSYSDPAPPSGTVYYFVVGTAKNKQQVYSRTKSIPGKDRPAPGPISIFPNPASPEIKVRLAGKGLFYLSVLDWKGRRLQKHKIFSSNKDNLITLEIRDFSPGVYYLEQTDDNGNTSVFKWIKK